VAVGTFNYDAYGAGFAIRKDGGAIDAYMAQVIALGAGARNWTFVPGNGQPSFTRSMTQPDGTNISNDPSESGVAIWNVTTAAGNLSGSGADQINIALIPNGTSFTIYATESGGGGGADKEARQIAKLNLAANDRSASSNPRASYIITQLPTQYDGYDVVDNPNEGGLVQGRPWTGIGTDDPANAAEPEATAWVLMDGPYGDENGFYGGQSWRKMAPVGTVNGKTSYNYVDESLSWDGTNWLYTNIGLGVVSTGTGGLWPWQATWTDSYKGTKITAAYVKTTNYPAVP
jgi:hypothetical protein